MNFESYKRKLILKRPMVEKKKNYFSMFRVNFSSAGKIMIHEIVILNKIKISEIIRLKSLKCTALIKPIFQNIPVTEIWCEKRLKVLRKNTKENRAFFSREFRVSTALYIRRSVK